MSNPRFNTLDEYPASLETVKAGTVRCIFELILTEFPELEAKIAWNVPQIHRRGKYVAGIAAYKHHLTFAPWSFRVMEDFKQRLENYVVFKGCFQIPVDWEIDRKLITDLVRARLAELDQD
jgi:uncharacterized protein YdhG (YjbR/CyaY superfamily)